MQPNVFRLEFPLVQIGVKGVFSESISWECKKSIRRRMRDRQGRTRRTVLPHGLRVITPFGSHYPRKAFEGERVTGKEERGGQCYRTASE